MNASPLPARRSVLTRNRIRLFIDYREQFYSSLRVSTGGMDLAVLQKRFHELGYELEIDRFSEIDPDDRFDDSFILYQSSEDRDLHYKEYIADWIHHIEQRGGTLIPASSCFRAHENKVFQSLLTRQMDIPGVYVPAFKVFGCYEDLERASLSLSFPLVLKSSTGCQSQGVTLARSRAELLRKARKFSRSFHLRDALRFVAKRWLRKGYVPESLHRKKFLLQEFIPGLSGDFKVLVYWDKVFVLQRSTRPNDFRASGSGRFTYSRDVPPRLLDCALRLREHFDCPFVSADVAFDAVSGRCILIEIQFLMFGTYTLENSPFHFRRDADSWSVVEGKVVLEEVFAEATAQFLQHASTS